MAKTGWKSSYHSFQEGFDPQKWGPSSCVACGESLPEPPKLAERA